MSGRTRYALERLLLTIPTLLAMSVFVFLLIRLVPGDPVRAMLGFRATDENVATIREQLGLDQPLATQYVDWIGGVLHGDLGQDYISHAPLTELLGNALPVTLELTILSMALALLVGVPLGVLAASGRGATRRLSDGFVIVGISIPDFWLGTLLVLLFAATLVWLPPSGYTPFSVDPLGNLRYMALPVLTLAVGEAAYILRTTRGTMEETLGAPFVTFLRAKGLSERSVVFRHALRNASVPIVTVVGIQFGVLLGGAIVVETLFGLPGVGRLTVTAINQRNYTVVQGSVLVIATMFILVNLATDLVYGWLNPRIDEAAGR
ncbi:MAG TPA: ABC transporter permease [Gaiellales bacterium]|nr:ABC transporter permease [Gaiellales bacterium]